MSAFEEALMILGMMVVTFGVRYSTLALSGRFQFPLAVKQALRYVPVAVLTAFVVPLIIAQRVILRSTPATNISLLALPLSL